MAQKSSKQIAEEAVLDLKGKLRQLNNALADKGATIAENAPLVAAIKAVEAMKSQAVTMSIFKPQQFYGFVDEELPPMRILDGYKEASLYYCFAQNGALKKLPSIENIGMAVNLTYFASSCASLIDVSLQALPNVTEMQGAFSSCPSLINVSIGAAPNVTNANFLFMGCDRLKDVSIDLSGGLLTDFLLAFSGCSNLRRVTGIIDMSRVTSAAGIFAMCDSLEEVRIKGLKEDLDLSACANLSLESVKYLVENAQSATNKTITLHNSLVDKYDDELVTLGETATSKGWTINYR